MFKKQAFCLGIFRGHIIFFPGKYYKEKRSKPLNRIGLKNVNTNSKKIIDENQKKVILKGDLSEITRRSSETSTC
jgi:hypothetical protein